MFSAWVQKWINQIAHVGWGAFLFLAVYVHLGVWPATIITVVFAAAKEGIFDPLTETKAEQGSGAEDFVFWIIGILLGSFVI